MQNDRTIRRIPIEDVVDRKLKARQPVKQIRDRRKALSIGVQLAQLRKEAGLSQSELAGRVGMYKQNISRLEKPSYEGCTLTTLAKIAGACGTRLVVSFEKDDSQTETARRRSSVISTKQPNHDGSKDVTNRSFQ